MVQYNVQSARWSFLEIMNETHKGSSHVRYGWISGKSLKYIPPLRHLGHRTFLRVPPMLLLFRRLFMGMSGPSLAHARILRDFNKHPRRIVVKSQEKTSVPSHTGPLGGSKQHCSSWPQPKVGWHWPPALFHKTEII